MTFWKVSDTRMNCLITEAEIAALGYSLEDLTQDREAYRRIFESSSQERERSSWA